MFYTLIAQDTPTTITTGSVESWNKSSNRMDCAHDIHTDIQAFQVFPVSLPFSTPVAFPLLFKYQ